MHTELTSCGHVMRPGASQLYWTFESGSLNFLLTARTFINWNAHNMHV